MSAFEFEHDGKKYELPPFNEMTYGTMEAAAQAPDEVTKMFIVVRDVLGEDAPALKAIRSMKYPAAMELVARWAQGVSVGESSGS